MDILPFGYIDGLKRYWRRRKYQRLDDSIRMKRKLKIARLGRKSSNKNNQKELMKPNKVDRGFKFTTPMKLVARLHEVYIDAMVRLGGTKRIDFVKNEAKRVAKSKPIPMLSASTNEMVDSRVVVELYKRVVSSRVQNSALVQEVF